MEEIIITTIQLKRANSTIWNSENPVLAEGELGLEIDTGKLKIGDGSTPWNSLEYSVRQVDNLLIDANSIKSTNANGDINFDPDGSGSVIVKSDFVAYGDLYAQINKKIATEEYVNGVSAPVQSVAGRVGDITLSTADVSGAVDTSDSRLSDAREWTAETVSQSEAEAGTSTTRRAWTAQRVWQAAAAWWNASLAKTKLDGIQEGATANQTDSYLLNREHHTGTQLAETISDFGTAAAEASPIQSVAGRVGDITLSTADVSGAVDTSDSRLSDAREWTAETVSQSEAEAGTSTTRRAWTAQRVWQAAAAWWSQKAGNIEISANTISTTNANGSINLLPNGTGTVDVGGKRITNLAGPDQDTDAANKSYVDAIKQGLDIKESVRLATTENIGLFGLQTIDGVYANGGDRVLVKDQTAPQENGIYVVSSGTWTRSQDAEELTPGTFVFIEEGSINADSGWVLTTNGSIVVGTTGMSFTQFSGAGQLVAGDGLTKSGNQINVGGTTARISVSSDKIDIDATYEGQTSITTLGSIVIGTWQADEIGTEYGGTGLNSYAMGDIIYASGTNILSKLSATGAAGYFLRMNQSGTAPEWSNSIDGGSP